MSLVRGPWGTNDCRHEHEPPSIRFTRSLSGGLPTDWPGGNHTLGGHGVGVTRGLGFVEPDTGGCRWVAANDDGHVVSAAIEHRPDDRTDNQADQSAFDGDDRNGARVDARGKAPV